MSVKMPRSGATRSYERHDADKASARALAHERQLAALPPVPHQNRSGFALAVKDARRAKPVRGDVNVATGKKLIDLSSAPSAMEEMYARHRYGGR